MKIDPTIQFPSDSQPNRITNNPGKAAQTQSSGSTTSSSSASGEDTLSLSSTVGEVQSLAANLANVPEVRSQHVAALQQQVNSGTYQPDSQKVADAIIADQGSLKR